MWCWPAPVVVTAVAVVFVVVVRKFHVGGGAGRETAVVRRIGRTGLDQQRADVCPGAGVENTSSRPNITFIGVAVLTHRGFNEQLGGGAGPRAAARRLAPRGLKQQRVDAYLRERGGKAGKCNKFYLSASRENQKGGSTNDSAAGWADRPPSNKPEARGTRNKELTHARWNAWEKLLKETLFYLSAPPCSREGGSRNKSAEGRAREDSERRDSSKKEMLNVIAHASKT